MAHKPDPALEAAMLGTAPRAPDPPPAAAEPAISADVIALAKLLLSGQQEQTAAMLAAQADAYAASMKTAMRPENVDPPLMSDFNPLGDRDHPRPPLVCPFTMGPAEMPPELLTVEEITLLNQITPGHYRVTKTDDTQTTVSFVPTLDSATGAITKMTILGKFGSKHSPEEKDNWPPLRVWLAEALGVPPPVRPIVRLPTGRIATPLAGTPGGTAGIVTGLLEHQMAGLGVIRGAVESMLDRPTNAMEPPLA